MDGPITSCFVLQSEKIVDAPPGTANAPKPAAPAASASAGASAKDQVANQLAAAKINLPVGYWQFEGISLRTIRANQQYMINGKI